MNEFIQSSIVYLVIVWSLWVTLRRYAPSLIRVPQQHLATWLSHHGFIKAGQYFTPQQQSGGCDSGCGSCKTGCATSAEQVVKFVGK